MTLDDAIANAEVVARREEYNYKTYAQTKPRNDVDKANCEHGAKSCLKSAKEHRQLVEWLRELKRADTLLKATYDLLSKQHGNYYDLNLLAETVYYDGAECDGNCLMEDIDAWMDERGIDHDKTGN